MRPEGRSSTDSLYFTYPQFSYPKQRNNLAIAVAVVIVGAGPVGMTAALGLAKEGISCVLLDAKDTFNDGSRAICIARQSFHILERIGAVSPFLEKSLGWTTGRSYYRGQQILEFEMPDSERDKYRPMYNIQQQYIEQYLWDAIQEEPLIDARWQSEVVNVRELPEGMQLAVRDPEGECNLTCDWLLAADGARSTIRSLRGLRLQGDNYVGRYVIADIEMDHDYPTIRRALFDPACRPGGTVLVHKQPDNIWRIDYQLLEGEDEAEIILEENVRATIASVLQELDYSGSWNLEWWSIYSANTLALEDYRDGRIFFIGDSAHIVPIFGVRGLNNGFADAQNIAWKLAWVLNGRAPESLLDSYTPERRGATLDVFANASKSAHFMTPETAGWRLMRDAALSLALDHPFAGELANPRQMKPYTYADSPAVALDDKSFERGPVPGAVLPGVKVRDGYLSDQLGPGFSLIVFNAELAMAVADLDLTIVVLDPGSDAADVLAADESTAYLVRPDDHIAARFSVASPEVVQYALQHAVAGDFR